MDLRKRGRGENRMQEGRKTAEQGEERRLRRKETDRSQKKQSETRTLGCFYGTWEMVSGLSPGIKMQRDQRKRFLHIIFLLF